MKMYKNEKIDRILSYIHQHYFEALNLLELSQYFKVSETYLSRYFKQKTGCHFVNYLNKIRAENAALELRQTDHSITTIAVDNGFSMPSVMNRYFKKIYGITPSEYRKEFLKIKEHDVLEEAKADKVKQDLMEMCMIGMSTSVRVEECFMTGEYIFWNIFSYRQNE